MLAALDAKIVVASGLGRRNVALDDLIVGPKRTTLGPGEIIVEVRLPAALGSQEFLKVGTRNAMVIAVANMALVVDWAGHSVRCALGSVGPVVIRREAEAVHLLQDRLGSATPADRRSRGVHRPGTGRRPDRSTTTAPRPTTVGTPWESAPTGRWSGYSQPARGESGAGIVGELIDYQLKVNGVVHDVADAWLGESLLYVLRERLGLPGSKNACEQGECGSCSVLLDGKLVCSCLVLAASRARLRHRDGRRALPPKDDGLSDIQAAFLAEGGVQCGFCIVQLIQNSLNAGTYTFIISSLDHCRADSKNGVIAGAHSVR